MRKLLLPSTPAILSSEFFPVLQLCATDKSLFPNLKTLYLKNTRGLFIPFIPLLLSSRTTVIDITFRTPEAPKAVIASMVTTFPTLCPNLQSITLRDLPRDPIIVAAVSGMLLVTNRNTLRSFCVDSLLTEEAREVIYKLANLCELSAVIEKGIPLPPAVLPNLTKLTITYDDGDDCRLQMFRGATLQKLESVILYSQSGKIGDLLRAFGRMALAASAQNTLSKSPLHTVLSPSVHATEKSPR